MKLPDCCLRQVGLRLGNKTGFTLVSSAVLLVVVGGAMIFMQLTHRQTFRTLPPKNVASAQAENANLP